MKKIVIVAFTAALCGSADAATWVDIGSGDGLIVQIDVDSIAPAGGGLIKAWVMHSFNEWQMTLSGDHKYYKSALQLDIFDCVRRTSDISQEVFYLGQNREGQVVRSSTYPSKSLNLTDVVPGSVGEGALNFACKWAKEKKKR
jgi:hypothetical protein